MQKPHISRLCASLSEKIIRACAIHHPDDMLSKTAELAIRAVVVLADHYGLRLVSTDEIASQVGAPRNYLSKTLHALVRGGVLTSVPGPGGGFRLAMSPDELPLATIVDVFTDPRARRRACLFGHRPCDPVHPCSAHERWTALVTVAREPLTSTTVAALRG